MLLLLLLPLQQFVGLCKRDASLGSSNSYCPRPPILCTGHEVEVSKKDGAEAGGGGEGGEPVGDGVVEHAFLGFGVARGEVCAAHVKVVSPPVDAGGKEAAVLTASEGLGELDGPLLQEATLDEDGHPGATGLGGGGVPEGVIWGDTEADCCCVEAGLGCVEAVF